jgi:4-amino-4-deoxy-L-arabinose transferase-like glycosyltransferase
MRQNKKWWLMPILLILLGMGVLIAFTGGSALAPFIYTIF